MPFAAPSGWFRYAFVPVGTFGCEFCDCCISSTALWLGIRAPAYALAAYVGWGRVYSRKHHWWDVVAGGAIGAASAYIFTKPFAKKHNLQVSPVSDGRSVGVYASMEF